MKDFEIKGKVTYPASNHSFKIQTNNSGILVNRSRSDSSINIIGLIRITDNVWLRLI